MMSVRFANQGDDLNMAVGDFVSNAVFGKADKFANYTAMAVHEAGKLIAGVVYNNYHPDEGVIELHAASVDRRWLTRPVLKAMFSMPFDVWGVQLCVLRVSERNTHMIRIAKAYGFQDYVIPRLRGRNEAEHILTLSDDDWRANKFNRGEA